MRRFVVGFVALCVVGNVAYGMDEVASVSRFTLSGLFKRGLNAVGIYPTMSHEAYMKTTEESPDGDYQISARRTAGGAPSSPVFAASIPPEEPKGPTRRENGERAVVDAYRVIQDLLNHV